MEVSRVFVKGLPPTIDETTFRKHFDYAGHITDIKLIPHRRIGYVGYQSSAEASKAVKRLNRSFIRMSRISVEPAKPVADPSLGKTTAVQKGESALPASSEQVSTSKAASENTKKRKLETLDESDPKLQEFLGVMQQAKNPASKIHDDGIQAMTDEQPTTVPPVPVDDESDEEYEVIPKRQKTESQRESRKPASVLPSSNLSVLAVEGENAAVDDAGQGGSQDAEADAAELTGQTNVAAAAATDDDWLRTRTNRLLDLVDEDEAIATVAPSRPSPPPPPVPRQEQDTTDRAEDEPIQEITSEKSNEIESKDETLNSIHNTGRLFVRNLPYSATEDDLRNHFEQYGDLEEVHVPMGSSGNKGFAFVSFTDPDTAVNAFQKADGHTFQGRILHVIPAAAKREQNLDEFALSKLPLKQQNLLRKKAKAATDKFNWNSLYMNQDAVVTSVSARLGITKSELLDPHSSDAAVKQAIAETSVIQETKKYFALHGVDLDAFKSGPRGDTAILVKNFSHGTSIEELRALFEEHGQVLKVLMPPGGTIAIVQFAQAPQSRAAFAKLAYRRFKNSVLFLEKAPKNLFVRDEQVVPATNVTDTPTGAQKLSVTELLERDNDIDNIDTSALFVKNISFSTTSADLAAAFQLEGFRSARVKTKTDPKKPGQVLSLGFGFVEFSDKDSALAALKVMDGQLLHGHKLQVRAAHRGHDAVEDSKKPAGQRTKLIVKNLPFEATKKDIRTLFGTHGQLRAVRIPKKFNQGSKGYAFADFTTPKEAEHAMQALQDTHLLGRKLVIQFAEAEIVDPESQIAEMQKKVGRQANRVALQQLTGGGRRKVNLGDDEDDADI